MILIGTALFLFFGRSGSLVASGWFLMARHGGCAEFGSLKRKVPDLGEVRDPTAFVTLMRDKGYQVTLNEVSTPNGKVVEVKMQERELSMMFVTPEVCQQSEENKAPAPILSVSFKKLSKVVMDACPFWTYTSLRIVSLRGRWKTHVIPD